MAILYSIIGFVFIIISVFLVFKRNDMKKQVKSMKNQKVQIEQLNQELDDIAFQLEQLEGSLSKINSISTKILKYMK